MVFKLTELYNTRYFYKSYYDELNVMFNTIMDLKKDSNTPYFAGSDMQGKIYEAFRLAADVKFDLADAKISSDITGLIRKAARNGIEFIDTKDAYRNTILTVNRERNSIDKSNFIELPPYDPDSTLKDYIGALSTETVYTVPNSSPEIYIPLSYLILASRPSIRLDLNTEAPKFFRYVYERIPQDIFTKYNEFFFTTPEGTMIVDFNSGYIDTQRIGRVTMQEAMTVGTLVPTALGKEKLISNPDWRSLSEICLKSLNNYRATKKQFLSDLYTER